MNVVGQSHVACVHEAANEAHVSLDIYLLKRSRVSRALGENVEVIGRDLRLPSRVGKAPVFFFYGGSLLNKYALCRHPTHPFDFVLPERHDLPIEDGAEVIPYEAIRASLRARTKGNLAVITRLVRVARGPIYQFESPPPPADSGWVAENLDSRMARRSARPVNSKFLSYKMWRLHSQIMRANVEQAGGTFVPHPREAVDEEGFLPVDLCSDATHGNVRYGAFLLRQMQALA